MWYQWKAADYTAVLIQTHQKDVPIILLTANIQSFINTVDKYINSYGLNYKRCINSKKHQYENNECGVYAIYFLIQRLIGFDFNHITDNVIQDKQMNQFRKIIFRPKK